MPRMAADEEPACLHFRVVGAVRVDRWPDRNHELHPERSQFVHHGLGVGPFSGVELPLALACPVEIVDDDD